MKNASHSLKYLDTCFGVDAVLWGGGAALLEEISQCGWTLNFYNLVLLLACPLL